MERKLMAPVFEEICNMFRRPLSVDDEVKERRIQEAIEEEARKNDSR